MSCMTSGGSGDGHTKHGGGCEPVEERPDIAAKGLVDCGGRDVKRSHVRRHCGSVADNLPRDTRVLRDEPFVDEKCAHEDEADDKRG